jgi:hypothetical protein
LQFEPARSLTLLILTLGFCAVLVLNLPGHLSLDSLVQLNDGRSGRYHTWHPPIMAWMLGLGDAVWRGAGLFVVGDAAMLFGALAALVIACPRIAWSGPFVAGALVLSPLCLIYQGIVWKDVLYADTSIAGFVLLAVYGARLRLGHERLGFVVAAFVLFSVSALARQNGFVSVLSGAVGLVCLRSRRPERVAIWRQGLWGVGSTIACMALVVTASAALDTRRVDEPGNAAQFQALQQWDLVGGVAHDPNLDLSALKPERLQVMVREAARHRYTPARVDPVAALTNLSDLMTKDSGDVSRSWRKMILSDFPAYAAHRWAVFYWTLFTPDIDQCLPVFTGIDGPRTLVARLGLKNGQSERDLGLEAYAGVFFHTPIYSHAAYALAALILIGVFVRRGGPMDICMIAMLANALVFTASFLVISFACDYRYLYALDLSVMTAGVYLAAHPREIPMAPEPQQRP